MADGLLVEERRNGGNSERDGYRMQTCRSRLTPAMQCVLLLLLSLSLLPLTEPACAGLSFPFDILPAGDHVIEHNQSLDLYCKLNTSHQEAAGSTSKDLKLYSKDPKDPNDLHSYETVSVVNDTTIKMFVEKPPLGSTYYYCELNSTQTKRCLTNVQVGYKPAAVDNFTCVSLNWENLTCTWKPPFNPVKTVYRLNISLAGRAGRIPRRCPGRMDEKNNTCIFTHESDPSYRQPHEYFSFEITGTNVLGTHTKIYKFHHYAHVIPARPENLRLINKTLNSALIAWTVPYPMFNFPPGLRFKIEYKSSWDPPGLWLQPKDMKNNPIRSGHTFNITGLKYKHTAYDVRVYLQSFTVAARDAPWSQPATITFVTPPDIPGAAPETTFGSFDVTSHGNGTDVFVYWSKISPMLENGAEFRYSVLCLMNGEIDCGAPVEKTLTYAKYPILPNNTYLFTISAVNEIGTSTTSSQVYVPNFGTVPQPTGFTKVAYEGGIYELSWDRVDHPHLSNYTLFWCEDDMDRPVPCKGNVKWIHIDKEDKKHISKNITMADMGKFYKFAVAANFEDGSSSGMTWSSCIIFHEKVLKRIDDVRISDLRARETNVLWEFRCSQNSALRGFMVYYCVSADPTNGSCMSGTESKREALNPSDRNMTLNDLKPYTTYIVEVSVLSIDASNKTQVGPKSSPRRFTTLEDAPSSPLNLHAVNITGSSITLRWTPPQHTNGRLSNYKLHVAGNTTVFKAMENRTIVTEYTVEPLLGDREYRFYLQACGSTDKCSPNSKVVVRTLIREPGMMMKPGVTIIADNKFNITWSNPAVPNGPLGAYEVVAIMNRKEVLNQRFNRSGQVLEVPNCKENDAPAFKIRAINLVNRTEYYGPWSDFVTTNCFSSVPQKLVIIMWVLLPIIFIILSVGLCLFIKRGWLHCRRMKDVQVKLPEGLDTHALELERDPNHDSWPPRRTGTMIVNEVPEDPDADADADEQSPLQEGSAKSGGDSSGCSVGRESVSSSITSDTHISSDSGAEADQGFTWDRSAKKRTSGPKERKAQNHHRNPVSLEGVTIDGLLVDGAAPGYTRVGFTTSTPPGKGYVAVASVTSPQQCNSYVLPMSPIYLDKPKSSKNQPPAAPAPATAAVAVPSYVPWTQLQEQTTRPTEPHNLQRHGSSESSSVNACTERDDEASGESTRDDEDSSENETETETVQGMPITVSSMPPYVSVRENPLRDPDDDDDPPSIQTIIGIAGRPTKDSPYVPHHVFGKESVNT